jgi:hypothetical protein
MTAKSISFFILFASVIYNSYFVFNDDLILIKKQYKNSLKSGLKKIKGNYSDSEDGEFNLGGLVIYPSLIIFFCIFSGIVPNR